VRVRIIAIIAFTVASLFPAVSAQAAEGEESIEFVGAGWGHGVGMSQYGAYGRALENQEYDTILEAYYTGAAVGTFGTDVGDPGPLFTNVRSDMTSTLLTVHDGPATQRTGMLFTRVASGGPQQSETLFTGDTISVTDETPNPGYPHGCTMTLTISGATTQWELGTCDVSVELTAGGAEPEHVVSATNCRRPTQCTYGYGTALHLVDNGSHQRFTHDCIGSCLIGPEFQGFDLVVETTLDEYTRGIAEVPYSWPMEALRTQAVAARSYAASFIVATEHRDAGCFCDVKNDSSYQVYAGWIGGWSSGDRWIAAATSTAGEVVTHDEAPDAGIVRAFYSSSNGGASEWVAEKWVANLPYLVSVPDAYSLTSANPRRSWSFEWSAETVVDAIWGTSVEYTLTGAQVVARNVSGSAKTVRFTALAPGDQEVHKDVSSATVTSAFGLYSWYFDIDQSGLAPAPPHGASTVGMQDPRTGIWSLRMSNGSVQQFYYGDPNDIPFVGDWNGNGIETVGLYRKSVGFLFLRNSNTQGVADVDIYYGIPGDVPIAGDWNGDGTDTIGIYRPSETRFYLRNTNTQGIADVDLQFGSLGDVPLAGDWNGDGTDTIGVYRPSTKMVYLTDSIATGAVSVSFLYGGTAAGDKVIAGDWDNDGFDTVGVFRSSNATFYLRDTFTQTSANISFPFGNPWMNPVAGYWGG
jgi:SpoIID/LytB domain protein